ncbi:MAG: hypothetical protein Q8M18_10985 [Bradyrhizobium sp.]|nr:hypothetical protein [Bradyrhizobium sp.]
MSSRHSIRGRRRIAHDLGKSERTVSRWASSGLLRVFYEEPSLNRVMVLPRVEEARERDHEARIRLGLPLVAWPDVA